jgi:hypothetical protein
MVMRAKTAGAGLCVVVALLGILAVGCGKGYRQIVVVEGGKTEFVTWGPGPKDDPQKIWVPGRTLVFRSDSEVPGAPHQASGRAGRIYRVNDKLELEEVGTFALTMPNDTLAYQYGR